MIVLQEIPAAIQASIVMLVFAAITVGGLYLVRRKVPAQMLREDHDVAGFTFGVIGAFYGVVLAFVIVAVWQRFERATEKVQDESIAVANLYALAQGLGQPARGRMQDALRTYTHHVLTHEWQAMAESNFRDTSVEEQRLWDVLLNAQPANTLQQTFLDRSIEQMTRLSDARQLRYMYYSESLPAVIWIVIYVGCAITLGFSYFFVTHRFRQQAIMSGTFAALIGLTILAISELATPYQGVVVVSNNAFRVVAASMNLPVIQRPIHSSNPPGG